MGLICHHGESAQSGHFVCDVASSPLQLDNAGQQATASNGPLRWRHYNDTFAFDVDEAQVLRAPERQSGAYMLLYAHHSTVGAGATVRAAAAQLT